MPELIFPDKPKPYIMAHRGNRVMFSENTLSAFRQAVQDGADIIETDVQITRDGGFVCIHDDSLDRTTDGTGLVAEHTIDQVRDYNAASLRPDLPFEPIPLIGELAEVIPQDVLIALELKSDAFTNSETCQRLLHELRKVKLITRTVILSFSAERLATTRSVEPTIPVGWITANQPWPISGVELFGPFWPLLLMNPLLTLIAHRKGQFVCPLDPTPDHRLWLYRLLGCDAVLSDNPRKTARALGRVVDSEGETAQRGNRI